MKYNAILLLMVGMISCARGEVTERAKPECTTSTDCDAPDMCRHQDCINNKCVDVWKDQDQDGYVDAMCGAQFNDCNDTNIEINPGTTETCDCIDNDCTDIIDDACNYQMKVLEKSTGIFGCFSAKNFRHIETPSFAPSYHKPPEHNTVFINDITEGWGSATVWYYGRDEKRYLFPSIAVFESWFGKGEDKCCLVKTVPNEVFMMIPDGVIKDAGGRESGGKVCYRPDAKIWKIDFGSTYYPESEYFYVVAHNCILRRLANEQVAEEIFGPDWKKLLDVMPYVEFREYGQTAAIESRADFDPLLEQSRSMTIDNNQDL